MDKDVLLVKQIANVPLITLVITVSQAMLLMPLSRIVFSVLKWQIQLTLDANSAVRKSVVQHLSVPNVQPTHTFS